MQGIKTLIPSETKIAYINALLQSGFSTVDCGSFVSAKVIPQMADTSQVINQLDFPENSPEIMALVVNTTGVEKAIATGKVNCLSYPYSVSPTFLERNLKTDKKGSVQIIAKMMEKAASHSFEWVIYLSMGLGNPYGDQWSLQLVVDEAATLYEMGLRRLPLSDILGNASPDTIFSVYQKLHQTFPDADFGLHLHTRPSESQAKLEAAWVAGVRSFETVLNGLGGCPTAAKEMVGNLSTQDLIAFCVEKNIPHGLDELSLYEAAKVAASFYSGNKNRSL